MGSKPTSTAPEMYAPPTPRAMRSNDEREVSARRPRSFRGELTTSPARVTEQWLSGRIQEYRARVRYLAKR